MRRTVLILSGLFALVAAGCRQSIVPTEPDAEFGEKLVAELQAHDVATCSSQLDPSIKTGRINQHIAQVAALIPQESPHSVELANWELTFTRSDRMGGGTPSRQVVLALQYEFSDRWQLMQYVWHSESGGPPLVKRFHIAGLRDSLDHLHGFWRQRLTLARLLVFLAAVILPLFSIHALIRCILAMMRVRYKAPWALLILVGIGQFDYNWIAGTSSVGLLYITLLSSMIMRLGLLGPWRLAPSAPLGAILFLATQRMTGDESVIGQRTPVPAHRNYDSLSGLG